MILSEWILMLCGSLFIPQENIKDKLRGIPIDVSVEIQDARRKRRQAVTSLSPVLDPNDLMETRPQV